MHFSEFHPDLPGLSPSHIPLMTGNSPVFFVVVVVFKGLSGKSLVVPLKKIIIIITATTLSSPMEGGWVYFSHGCFSLY